MNICIKKYKVFIISLCLVSMFSFDFCQLRVDAVVGVDDAVVVGGGVTIGTGTLVYAIGSCLVAGGVLLDTNTNDGRVCKYIASQMIASGNAAQYFGTKVLDGGKQVLTWTKDGLSYISSTLESLKTTGLPLESGISYYISAGGSVTFTCFKADGVSTYTSVVSISTAGNYTVNLIPSTISTGSYNYKIVRVSSGAIVASGGPLKLASGGFSISSGGSVCLDLPSSSVQSYNDTTASDVIGSGAVGSDGSVSYQPKVGIPISDNGTGTGVFDTPLSFPYGQTWGDITGDLSLPVDTPVDTPVDSPTTGTIDTGKGILDIPILGDILKVLQKILDFLGTMIGSLVTALINALEQLLTKLFVPTADMFNDFYSDIESNVKSKFPYSVSILNSLKVNADEFKDIHVTIWGHDCVIVSAQFVNDNISWIRVVTSCFWIFSLFVYVWRKINAVLNGGDVNSTTVYVPGGVGSGPPSVI